MSASFGYSDTPIIPGTEWHVHDGARPQPKVVTPPTETTQAAPGSPPSDAVVLFDGTSLDGWRHADGRPAEWKLENGYMEVVPKTRDIYSKQEFGSAHLHLEWAAPAEIKGEGQGRGNSGVFLMGEYEIQVLDCYQNPTYADGITGAIYGQYPPRINACRKPGEWHTYDIFWVAPTFDGDKLKSPAYVTVIHNGLLLHLHQPLMGVTSHKVLTSYSIPASTGPLRLQDHGDLVRFRNIWYRPL